MSGLVLTLREALPQPVDVGAVVPERICSLGAAEIAQIGVTAGNRRHTLDELFEVERADGEGIVIRPAGGTLDFVGRDMTTGTITVEGDAGDYIGLGMRGGRIAVQGSAGIFAGCEMAGGEIRIAGDAGPFAASCRPGERFGMRGGTLIVGGSVGDRVGDRMRRGLVVVGGDAGAFACARMIAGTVIVVGGIGAMPGTMMRRGTLIAAGTITPPSTFNDCGRHELPFFAILMRHLRTIGVEATTLEGIGLNMRRFAGDLAVGGMGEILTTA